MNRAAAVDAEPVEITGYVYAGSSPAYEALGSAGFADVACAHCGARISHVFLSSIGPLGGDCAASLTGDNATRSAVRRQLQGMLRKMRGGKVSTVRVTREGLVYGALRGTGWTRESDGATIGKREIVLASGKTEQIARMVAASALQQISAEEPGYLVTLAVEST